MKKLLLVLSTLTLLSFTEPCYKVTSVVASADAPDMKKERVIFGIKQLAEEIVSEKFTIIFSLSQTFRIKQPRSN